MKILVKESRRLALALATAACCLSPLAQAENVGSRMGWGDRVESAARADELALLGRMLFEDTRLSADGTISCATCHVAKRAFTDGHSRALGLGGQVGTRNTPSLLNIVYEKELFWDGRTLGLEQQVRSPLFNPREQGLADDKEVERILSSSPEYVARFRKAFGVASAVSTDQLTIAIAAYERTLLSTSSPFDRYWYGHQNGAISGGAQRGLELFRGRAGCANCHMIGNSSAPFNDHEFHGSSVRLDPAVTADLPNLTAKVVVLKSQRASKQLNDLIASDTRIAELGRFLATLDPADIGKFRTPSLRNVTLTAPYMHDGSVPTLDEAVQLELYSREVGGAKPIVLTSDERADLVEFLHTLNSTNAR